MNLFKNRFGAIKGTMVILALAFIVASVSYIIPVLAVHVSTVDVNPSIVGGGQQDVLFTVTVCNDISSTHDIHEFRIYYEWEDFTDYTDVQCQSKTGWFLVQPFETIWGDSCVYSSTDDSYNIENGECTDFQFTADTPIEECCRELRFETRDEEFAWIFHDKDVCVDAKDPITDKYFVGPQKKEGDVEWIDGVTEVVLDPADPEPHPSGVSETLYVNILAEQFVEQYSLQCDPEFPCWNWDFCQSLLQYAGNIPEGWWDTYEGPFLKEGESCHVLFYYSIDEVGNEENIQVNCFFVDTTPPTPSKDVGEPNVPCRDGECSEFDYWVRDPSSGLPGTEIELDCVDEGPHPSGGEEVCFRVSFDYPSWHYITEQYCSEALETITQAGHEGDWCCVDPPETIIFEEDSLHDLEYFCRDAVDKKTPVDLEYFRVDSQPPIIEKDMFGSYLGDCPSGTYIDHGDCYVADDGSSGVDITVYDDETYLGCAVDDLDCYYDLIWILPTGERILIEEHYEFSTQAKITFTEDSTHELYIFCEDALGNWVEHTEEFLVDSTPPETTKTYGDPTKVEGGYRWITSSTPITLTAEDEKVGVAETYWRNTLVEIPDDACLEECQCESPLEEVFDLTGDVEGTVTKTNNGDSFTWTIVITSPNIPHNVWGVGMAFATSTDQPAFQVWYREYEEPYGWYYQDYGTGWNGAVTALPTEGITATGDHTGQTFTITIPKSKLGGGACDTFYWGAQARTNLLGKYPSTWAQWSGGSQEVSGMATSIVGSSGDWNTYDVPFYKPEESCHLIEYYSVDLLGNEEPVNWQCVFVDDTAPTILEKLVGEPKVEKDGKIYITGETDITMRCEDQGPHPVNDVSLWYRYRISDDCQTWGEWLTDGCEGEVVDGWCDPNGNGIVEKTINFPQDSCHELEYYCEDALGHETTHEFEIDVVDNQPPEITKTIVGPWSGDCLPEEQGDICYIDGVTEIHVDVTDPEPHPVGEVTCRWSYRVDGGDVIFGGQGLGGNFIIQFPEESRHDLVIGCVDALGNKVSDEETFFVDKTPPETTKTYEGPQYTDGTSKWINFDTMIYLDATDDKGPHDSGVAAIYWRDQIVDDMNCEEPKTSCFPIHVHEDAGWNLYTGPFNKDEESCHMIEYYSVDNVNKKELVKAQCVFVDNSPPTPEKEVGEPKAKWHPTDIITDPDRTDFYPEIVDKCWKDESGNPLTEEQCKLNPWCIECWKVTMGTPISLGCLDPDPHPVDEEIVCFKIEVDGIDNTERYCMMDYGEYNETSGFCCSETEIEDFVFAETTEHNLKYYCIDALGNSNKDDMDEEKFKVRRTTFEIPLYFKWNLISVPFVLLSDDPAEVFKDTEGVESVWAYNGTDWLVYTPGVGPDTLDSIEPGWGYWVLETKPEPDCGECNNKNCMHMCEPSPSETIVIGGDLFDEGPSWPAGRDLVDGWNLIGYYGTSWELYNKIEFDPPCGPGFHWFPGKYTYGDKVYCALNSLVDTQEGYPKWSSLWSYINCGCYNSYWLGLNTCADPYNPQTRVDRMYAGRGYWLEIDEEEFYSPATTCIWNSDFQCVSSM